MSRTEYFDLHRILRRLGQDDLRRLWDEFGPYAIGTAEPARVDALRAMMPWLLRRVLTRGERPVADLLVRIVGLAPAPQNVRPLLAVLVLAPELSVRSRTVEDALVAIGPDAVEPLIDALKGLATFPHTPVRVVEGLANALARIGDPRAVDAIVTCLNEGAHGQWALLDALLALSRGARDDALAQQFVASRAANRQHAIEKGLWPRHGRKGISRLRVRLMRARYVRALRRWQLPDGAKPGG